MAKKIEELPVYQRAVEFCVAITAILGRPALRKDRRLHEQISAAADSITSNMEEGFEQGTDKSFANYLFIARGSLGEVLGRLRTARRKQYITESELAGCQRAGDELGKMISGFIRYLHESDFKDRGRFRLKQRKDAENVTETPEPEPASPLSTSPVSNQRPKRNQRSGKKDQRSGMKDSGSEMKDSGSGMEDSGSGIRDEG